MVFETSYGNSLDIFAQQVLYSQAQMPISPLIASGFLKPGVNLMQDPKIGERFVVYAIKTASFGIVPITDNRITSNTNLATVATPGDCYGQFYKKVCCGVERGHGAGQLTPFKDCYSETSGMPISYFPPAYLRDVATSPGKQQEMQGFFNALYASLIHGMDYQIMQLVYSKCYFRPGSRFSVDFPYPENIWEEIKVPPASRAFSIGLHTDNIQKYGAAYKTMLLAELSLLVAGQVQQPGYGSVSALPYGKKPIYLILSMAPFLFWRAVLEENGSAANRAELGWGTDFFESHGIIFVGLPPELFPMQADYIHCGVLLSPDCMKFHIPHVEQKDSLVVDGKSYYESIVVNKMHDQGYFQNDIDYNDAYRAQRGDPLIAEHLNKSTQPMKYTGKLYTNVYPPSDWHTSECVMFRLENYISGVPTTERHCVQLTFNMAKPVAMSASAAMTESQVIDRIESLTNQKNDLLKKKNGHATTPSTRPQMIKDED